MVRDRIYVYVARYAGIVVFPYFQNGKGHVFGTVALAALKQVFQSESDSLSDSLSESVTPPSPAKGKARESAFLQSQSQQATASKKC